MKTNQSPKSALVEGSRESYAICVKILPTGGKGSTPSARTRLRSSSYAWHARFFRMKTHLAAGVFRDGLCDGGCLGGGGH